MSFLLPVAAGLAPLAGELIGKLFHHGNGVKGKGAMLGGNMMGGAMMGGRRKRRGGMVRRLGNGRRMKGKGWVGDVARKAFHFGKKVYELSKNKHIRGLVKHGVKVFKHMREERSKKAQAAKKTVDATPIETGGRRKRLRIRIKNMRGHGMLYNSSANPSGPLP